MYPDPLCFCSHPGTAVPSTSSLLPCRRVVSRRNRVPRFFRPFSIFFYLAPLVAASLLFFFLMLVLAPLNASYAACDLTDHAPSPFFHDGLPVPFPSESSGLLPPMGALCLPLIVFPLLFDRILLPFAAPPLDSWFTAGRLSAVFPLVQLIVFSFFAIEPSIPRARRFSVTPLAQGSS